MRERERERDYCDSQSDRQTDSQTKTDRNTERHRDRQIDREETKGGRREGGWVGSAGAVIVFALPHFLVFSSPIMLRLTLLFKIILKHLVDQQPIMACDNSIKPIDFAKTAISRPSMKFKMRMEM